jgi:hypothetical protein
MLRRSEANTSNSEAFIVMNPTVDWSSKIEEIAGGPFPPGGNLCGWLESVRRKISGVSFWHVQQLYKGELKDPKYSIAYQVLSAADRARLQKARLNVANAEAICRETIARLEAVDADHHRTQIDALRTSLDLISARDSAGN